jgi:hypothetical protein
MRPLLPLLALLLGTVVAAQGPITGRVVDGINGTPLPYATILLVGTDRGTISNPDGYFDLPATTAGDSIRVSFVGYRTRFVAVSEVVRTGAVRMERSAQQLREVTIRPDDRIYRRIAAIARKLQRTPSVEGRLFFGMETYSDSTPVEMIHGFYNARTNGARLSSITLKQGRIGIAPKNDRYYINYNTTRAFALMDIQAEQSPYPHSPLRFTKAADLRRGFHAEVVSTGEGPDAVDHLRVVPRPHNPEAFALDLWVEPRTERVRALELQCTNCPKHPFIPLFDHGHIDTVDMRYRQTWTTDAPHHPEVMELALRVAYTAPDFSDNYRTHAVMHLFDTDGRFIEPLFTMVVELPDYQRMGWLPDDPAFWQRMHPPLPTERQRRDMAFLQQHDLRDGDWLVRLGPDARHVTSHYARWSATDRIWLHGVATRVPTEPFKRVRRSEITGEYAIYRGPLPVQLMAQIYLDLDTVNGRLLHRSATVLDGYYSFDLVADQPWNAAFHNIWFDLCEVERRALEQRLNAPGVTLERARALHAEYTARLQGLTDRYMQETGSGEKFEGLLPWNARVKQILGIDNLKLFGF